MRKMTKLANRLRKLEGTWRDANGLVPHTAEWLSYWKAKLGLMIAGEDVDLTGISLDVTDAIIAESRQTGPV
jgi:hypothetical protein